jgi:hypothetical protein
MLDSQSWYCGIAEGQRGGEDLNAVAGDNSFQMVADKRRLSMTSAGTTKLP